MDLYDLTADVQEFLDQMKLLFIFFQRPIAPSDHIMHVHDMIRRCNRTLEEYEEKLHLVEKFLNIRSQVIKIHELADKYHAEDIAAISNVILEEL